MTDEGKKECWVSWHEEPRPRVTPTRPRYEGAYTRYVRADIAGEVLAVLVKARDTLLDDHPGDPCQMEVIKMIEDIIANAKVGDTDV